MCLSASLFVSLTPGVPLPRSISLLCLSASLSLSQTLTVSLFLFFHRQTLSPSNCVYIETIKEVNESLPLPLPLFMTFMNPSCV